MEPYQPPNGYTSMAPSTYMQDSEFWILRVPNSISLEDLSSLVKGKKRMSLTSEDTQYELKTASLDIDNGDLSSIDCFVASSNGLQKGNALLQFFNLSQRHQIRTRS